MGRFLRFIHILPGVGGAQLGMLDIAKLGPHGVQGNIIRWTQGVVRRSLHTTETQPVEAAQLLGMVFPSGEKLLISPPPAIFLQQHGLRAIKHLGRVVALIDEGLLKLRGLVAHGQTR